MNHPDIFWTNPTISSRPIAGPMSGLSGDVGIMSDNCRMPSDAFREISFCRVFLTTLQ